MHREAIDLAPVYDSVQVKWEGSSSTTKMKGTLIILKAAIKDKRFIEWIENRELYDMWEE